MEHGRDAPASRAASRIAKRHHTTETSPIAAAPPGAPTTLLGDSPDPPVDPTVPISSTSKTDVIDVASAWVTTAMTTPGLEGLRIRQIDLACATAHSCRVYMTVSGLTGESPVFASAVVDEVEVDSSWEVSKGEGA